MKCKEIQELIFTDYIDNELSDEHRAMIEDHLLQCDSCHKALQEARSLNNELSGAKEVQLDKAKIWQKIEYF